MAPRLKTVPNNWVMNGEPFEMSYEDIRANDYFGFVYLMEEIDTGKKYVGEKGFHSFLTPKGKTNKKKQESNWRKYPSSNALLSLHIKNSEEARNDKYKFTILGIAKDKSAMKYLECKFIFSYGCMESDDFYNANIKINIITKYKDFSNRVIVANK
jgi:hypothetical protein